MNKIQLHAKDFMGTATTNVKHVAVLGGSMIISQKFIDLKAIADRFNIKVESGSMIEKVITHQGAIKFLLPIIILHFTRNKSISKHELFKWAMLGLMLQGMLQEANQLSGGKSGQIGDDNLDEQMRKAAEEIKQGMHGEYLGDNPTTQYIPSVQGTNPTTEYIPSVQGAYMETGAGVAGGDDDYSFLRGDDDDF
jgi:hypothetical protein